MNQQTGKIIIVAGILLVIAGIIIYFFQGYFRWLGRLPGDIRMEKENFRFFFPVTSMIIVSIVVTILVNILKRWF